MVYTAFARMPGPIPDPKRPFDLTGANELLMAERRRRLRYLRKPQAGLSVTRRVPALC